MKDLIDAAKAALPTIEKAIDARRKMGIPDRLGGLPAVHARLKGAVAVAEQRRCELLAALEEIAELDGDCEQQKFRLTRFQAAQVARAAIHKEKGANQ